MNNPIQLKIYLSEELQTLLKLKASKFGVPLTQYVKHVLMKDVDDQTYPTFPASHETEQEAREALAQRGKAISSKSFFRKLQK